MAVRGGDVATSEAATVFTAEAVAVTLGPIDVPADAVRAVITANSVFLLGAGSTQVTMKIRRGLLVGDTLVANTGACATTAGLSAALMLLVVDPLVLFGTITYCITLFCNGAGLTNEFTTLAVLFM